MAMNKKTVLTGVIVAVLAVAAIVIAILLQGKVSLEKPTTNTGMGMGTVIVESFYCKDESVSADAIKYCTDTIDDLDYNRLSWRKKSSEIYNVNTNGSGYVDKATYDCLSTCIDVSKNCNGRFDSTVGNLSGLWNITTENDPNAYLPTEKEIKEAMGTVGYDRLNLSATEGLYKVEIAKGQKIDLGAVGKGLACDVIHDYLKDTSIVGGTVSVGGSILVYGKNPTQDNGTWNIGVRDPISGSDNSYMAILNCGECCISTSGDYEKFFYQGGKKYHHILDPMTGYPAESNITSVTIIADSGIITDALSTACFILGYCDDSLALIEKYDAEAIFIKKDKTVYITDGIKDNVTITNDEFKLGAEVA